MHPAELSRLEFQRFRVATRRCRRVFAAECDIFASNARAVARTMPVYLRVYLLGTYVVMCLLVWWMPVCDFDTMTSYLARIALERLGPLKQTATLELQYVFPKFVDYLHAPLLRWGWFQTLPNFALFTFAIAFSVWRLPPRISSWLILGLMACSPVVVSVTSAKNDITLALLSYLFWLWIYHANRKAFYYPAVGMLFAALMIGTKWHGLALAPLFMALLVIEIIKARNFGSRMALGICCALPLAWHMSSADVYFDNLRSESSLCPTPEYLHQEVRPGRNLLAFSVSAVLDTFDVPLYMADTRLHGKLWRWLNRVTLGARTGNYAILPTTHISVYGVSILIVIAGSIVAAFSRGTPWPVRASALAALAYCVVLMTCFQYCTWINRYFLTTYVLALIPCAYCGQFISCPRAMRYAFYGYLVFVSSHSLLMNQEKRLVPFHLYEADQDRYQAVVQKSIFADLWDREALQFHLWSGHLGPYQILRRTLRDSDRLLIVNAHRGNDCPFIYPFIKNRSAENTRIVNLRFGQTVPADLRGKYDYVLSFHGRRNDPSFSPLFDDDSIAIYRNDFIGQSANRRAQAVAAASRTTQLR